MAQIPYDAVLFDLDEVLTSTSPLHAVCWKRVFEEILGEPFDTERDYLAHVDGKPRADGVGALGGRLSVASPAGAGTRLRAEFPSGAHDPSRPVGARS